MNKVKQLVRKVKKRDKQAFIELYKIFANKIYYVAFKHTQDKWEADDCVQEVFTRVAENIVNFDERKSNFGTWIFQITLNYLTDKYRVKKRNCYLNNELVYEEIIEHDIDNQIRLSELEALVGEYAYSILMMKLGLDMTFKEISEELNIAISKIKRDYYKAYKLVKSYIEKGEL